MLHLFDGYLFGWFRPLVTDGTGRPFDQFSGNTNDSPAGTDTSLGFGFGQSFIAIGHHRGDVADSPGMHVSQSLALPADTDDFYLVAFNLADKGFDKFRTDIQADYIVALGFGTVFYRVFDLR